jgi:hypothetical protein
MNCHALVRDHANSRSIHSTGAKPGPDGAIGVAYPIYGLELSVGGCRGDLCRVNKSARGRRRGDTISLRPTLRKVTRMATTTAPFVTDDQVIDSFRDLLDGQQTMLEPRLNRIENDVRHLSERASRPPILLGGLSGDGETVGGLVTKDSRFAALQTAGRGIARIDVARRLTETKSTVVLGTTLKPGVQTLPIAPLLPGPPPALADLIPQRVMSEGGVQFVRQTAPRPIASAQIHQGDVKAEGALALETITLAPATLAIWIPASRQALRDVAGLTLLINSELLYAVKTLEEKEVLNGDGTEGHLTGILPLAPALAPTAGDSALDAIARGIASLASQGIVADGVVLHPTDWLNVMLSKNTTEDYLLGSPAAATSAVVWGTRLAFSTQMPLGTFLAGNFSLGVELVFRENATIDVSTEHSDFFIRNLICIRAEESLALCVRQPLAFVKSTFAPAGLRGSPGAAPPPVRR